MGGGSRNFAAFGSLNGSWSDRFLDPVNFDNLHNTGDTQRGFLRLDYASDDLEDQVRFTTLVGRTNRDVPNTYTQQDAGQDQRVESRDQNYNLGWTHVLSDRASLDANVFGRTSTFKLLPSAGDTPVTAASDRSLDNYGLNASVGWAPGLPSRDQGRSDDEALPDRRDLLASASPIPASTTPSPMATTPTWRPTT